MRKKSRTGTINKAHPKHEARAQMHPPRKPCQRSLAQGRSGVLRTFCLWPCANNRARHYRTVKKIKLTVWQWRKTKDEKFIEVFVPRHSHDERNRILFFTLPSMSVTLVAARTRKKQRPTEYRPMLFSLTQTKSACTVYGRLYILRGTKEAAMPCCSCVPCPRLAPPHLPHASRGHARYSQRLAL